MLIWYYLIATEGLPDGLAGKEPTCSTGDAGDTGSIPRSGRSPGEGRGNSFSILAGKISWTEEPDGLWSMRSQRVRHDWSDQVQCN